MSKNKFLGFIKIAIIVLLMCGIVSLVVACNNDSTADSYTIFWYNYDDTLLETDKDVQYGDNGTYDGSIPIREPNGACAYEFFGWDTVEESVVGGYIKKRAIFTEVERFCTITWKNYDGSVLSTTAVKYGNAAQYSGLPTKPATESQQFTFVGWLHNEQQLNAYVTNVVSDMSLTARFTEQIRQYSISWITPGGTYNYYSDYNTVPAFSNTNLLTKKWTEQYRYEFLSWDKELVATTEDTTYTAQFDEIEREYNIFVDNVNIGKLPYSQVVGLSEAQLLVLLGGKPTKTSTAQYEYEFDRFADQRLFTYESSHLYVDGAVYYDVVWENNIRSYNVVWSGADGNILKEELLEYGSIPTWSGDNPTKVSDSIYLYEFDSWDDLSAITGTRSIIARFAFMRFNLESTTYTLVEYRPYSGGRHFNIPSVFNGIPVTKIAANCISYLHIGFISEITIPKSISTIPSYLSRDTYNSDRFISGKLNFNVPNYNFSTTSSPFRNGISEVVFGADVERVPNYMFRLNDSPYDQYTYNTALMTVSWEKGARCAEIGNYSFYRCKNLTVVTFPDSIKVLGSHAFSDSGLTEVIFGAETMLNSFGANAFSITALSKIFIPLGVTTIGENCFASCSVLTIYAATMSKTGSWSDSWNPIPRPVYWGQTGLPK